MLKNVSKRGVLRAGGALIAGTAISPIGPALAADKPLIAFVVNVPADFWVIARAGLEKAASELPKYDCQMFIPGEMSAAAQKRILEDLMAKGVAALTISPVDPGNSTDIL